MKKLLLALTFLALFILIFLGVKFGFFSSLDSFISSNIATIQIPILTEISIVLAYLFDMVVLIVVTIVLASWLFYKGKRKDSLLFVLTMLASGAIVYVLKELTARARPINPFESGFAFPGGHALGSVVFFGLLIWLVYRHSKSKAIRMTTAVISITLIILIAFSRIYLNVHWLSDVLAGLSLGLSILFFSLFIRKRI